MSRPIPMARFDLGLPLAGSFAALLSGAVLGVMAAKRGLPAWAPLNTTSHALHGPDVTRTALDLSHTGVGAVIHIAACFLWSALTVLLIRRARKSSSILAWVSGLITATMAGLIDYGLLPAQFTPGWELVLPPLSVGVGLAAMGAGISLGLIVAGTFGDQEDNNLSPQDTAAPTAKSIGSYSDPTLSPLEELRHPAQRVLDQRQSRIDPANAVTEDPNLRENGMKQPGDPNSSKRAH